MVIIHYILVRASKENLLKYITFMICKLISVYFISRPILSKEIIHFIAMLIFIATTENIRDIQQNRTIVTLWYNRFDILPWPLNLIIDIIFFLFISKLKHTRSLWRLRHRQKFIVLKFLEIFNALNLISAVRHIIGNLCSRLPALNWLLECEL